MTKQENKRFKLRYEFWLEPQKPGHEAVAEIIEGLKEQRKFAPGVRDSLLLFDELQRGRTDMLLELFPWLEESILSNASVVGEIARLNKEIDTLRSLLLQVGMKHGVGPKPLGPMPLDHTLPPMPLPVDDDLGDVTLSVKRVESDGRQSAGNFLDSAFGLQQ